MMAEEHQFTTEEISLGQALHAASVAEANLERVVEEIIMANMSSPADLSNPAFMEVYSKTMSFSREIGGYFQELLMQRMELEKQAPELLERMIEAKMKVDERYTPQAKVMWDHLFKLSSGGDELKKLLSNGEVPNQAKETVSKIIESIGYIAASIAASINDGVLKPVR
ncbi:MAG: hypothetical protein ACFFEE_11985 [Candidatus Thorarchaeota archaeon]